MSDQSSHPADVNSITLSLLAQDPEMHLERVIATGKTLVVIQRGKFLFTIKPASGDRDHRETARIEDFQFNPWRYNTQVRAAKRPLFLTRDRVTILEITPLDEQQATETPDNAG